MMRSDLYFEDDISETVDGMSNTSIPIDDPASIENIKSSEQTQVLVIHLNGCLSKPIGDHLPDPSRHSVRSNLTNQ